MSVVVTNNGEYIDTDFEVVFYCNDGSILSESEAVEGSYKEPEDGIFSG